MASSSARCPASSAPKYWCGGWTPASPIRSSLTRVRELGVPGLVQAVRDGTVVIANALGSGVVEARALLSFLPALAPTVLGDDLALPNVATWWLGQARARDEIIDRLDEMVIASAFLGELPGHGERREVLGTMLEPEERTRILEQITHRGI